MYSQSVSGNTSNERRPSEDGRYSLTSFIAHFPQFSPTSPLLNNSSPGGRHVLPLLPRTVPCGNRVVIVSPLSPPAPGLIRFYASSRVSPDLSGRGGPIGASPLTPLVQGRAALTPWRQRPQATPLPRPQEFVLPGRSVKCAWFTCKYISEV